MEGLQCNFADGKDMDDVMRVIDEWNAYGDKLILELLTVHGFLLLFTELILIMILISCS